MVDSTAILLDRLWYVYTDQPFRPFRIVTKAGVVHRIKSQSALSWRKDRPIWVGVRQSDGTWIMVDTAEIADIAMESEGLD